MPKTDETEACEEFDFCPEGFSNFYELFKQQVKRNKDRVYIINAEDDTKITYDQCDKITDRLANYLISQDITPKDIIATVMGNTLEYIYLLIASFKVGATFMPLNPKLGEKDAVETLKTAPPKLVFGGPNGIDIEKLALDKFPDHYEDKFKPTLDEDMLLLYTSGTTGKPKGIILTQGNVLPATFSGGKSVGLRENKVIFDLLPLSFSGGIIPGLLIPLSFSGTTIITQRFDKESFWKTVDKYRVNYIYAVPTIFSVLLEQQADLSKYDLSCIDVFFNSSAAIPHELMLKFEKHFKAKIYDVYGLSEAMGIAIHTVGEKKKKNSVGKIFKEVQVRIVDENDKELPLGEEGEIIVKSPWIMKEYFKMPEETKKAIKDGWFYTGDLGYTDNEDFMYITGRKKHVIIKGGMNISPQQVSDVFFKHKDVIDAAAVGIPDEKYGEDIVALVVIKKGSALNEETLMELAKEHLIKFKVPKEIRIIDNIPRTHLGKLKIDEMLQKISSS
jgi:acyl-CoA synthetase (AMP-forming)/AMP-acid ligase II